MRVLVGAALAALVLVVPAAAQTTEAPASTCPAITAAPTNLPDGAQANRQQMERANEQFTAWAEATRTALQCNRQEAEAAQARANALGAQYNAAAESLRAAIAAWEAEAAEFNARGEQRRMR